MVQPLRLSDIGEPAPSASPADRLGAEGQHTPVPNDAESHQSNRLQVPAHMQPLRAGGREKIWDAEGQRLDDLANNEMQPLERGRRRPPDVGTTDTYPLFQLRSIYVERELASVVSKIFGWRYNLWFLNLHIIKVAVSCDKQINILRYRRV